MTDPTPVMQPEPCPVIVGQQKGVGPGLFITCGKAHTVAEHTDEDDQPAYGEDKP